MYRYIVGCLVALILHTECFAGQDDWDQLISPEQLKSDFSSLYQTLQAAHADLYAHRSKQEYDALFTRMLEALTEPLSLFDAQVTFQRFVAYGNVAHARIEFPGAVYQRFRERGGHSFPIYLRIVDGRAYVGEDYSNSKQINLGDEIISLDNQPMPDWLQRVRRHISADSNYIADSLLEFTFPAYLWLELGEKEHFDISLKKGNGQLIKLRIDAVTQTQQQERSQNNSALFSLSSTAREAKLLKNNIAYLRPGPFYHVEDPDSLWDNTGFIQFIDSAFGQFIDARSPALIIDLRANPGGDNSFSDHMIAWIANEPFRFSSAFLIRSSDAAAASNQARLDTNPGGTSSVSRSFAEKYATVPRGEMFEFDIPFAQPHEGKRYDGKVYVLINRHSYSNAVNVAAIFQDYQLGTVVGEKTSDLATTYGAMESFTLPESGISVGFPKAHIIRPSGNKTADGVTPDWVIPTPITAMEHDTVLQALLGKITQE